MTEFVEHITDDNGEEELDILDEVANGDPYVMVIASDFEGDKFNISLKAGGGIVNLSTIRALLYKATMAVDNKLEAVKQNKPSQEES